jgi:hypothetical protein
MFSINIRVLSLLGIAISISVLSASLSCISIMAQTEGASISGASVSGFIREINNRESAIGVSVILTTDTTIKKPLRYARTNNRGYYTIPNVGAGTWYMVVRGIGWKESIKKIEIISAQKQYRMDIDVEPISVHTNTAVVEADKSKGLLQPISTISVSKEIIEALPVLGGEKDVFRALQLLPGVKMGSEISSGLYVRGGSPDQNLTLVDGVLIYNPLHLGGFLSSFNTDALRDVQLIKGAFPAEYGGRLSSVVDITMKDGSQDKVSGAGMVSLVASRVSVDGPLSSTATFAVSARRTYLDLFTMLAGGSATLPNYYFYDLNAKFTVNLGSNDRISFSGYMGKDVLSTSQGTGKSQGDIGWSNMLGSVRWMHIVSPSLFFNVSLFSTTYSFNADLRSGIDGSVVSFGADTRVLDIGTKATAEWIAGNDHIIKFGTEITRHALQAVAGANDPDFKDFIQQNAGANAQKSLETAVFAQDEWSNMLGIAGLNALAGMRFVHFSQGNRFLAEPRLSLSVAVADGLTLKTAYSQANQFLQVITRNNVALPTDIWYAANEQFAPAHSTQYVLGTETLFGEKEWLFSVEGYYKTMNNVLEFKDDNSFQTTNVLASQITAGMGESYGVEFFLNKRIGNLTGWIGYTWSKTTRTFADLNNGKPFFPRYDSRHDIQCALLYKLGESWELGATWTFMSGQAVTLPTAKFNWDRTVPIPTPNYNLDAVSDLNTPRLHYSERNAQRLPAFHKLDLSFTHRYRWFDTPFYVSLNVYNAYNRQNPYAWDISTRSLTPRISQWTLLPILPSVGMGFTF